MADVPTAKPDPPTSTIVIEDVPRELKGRAVQAARERGMKLGPWMIEAIREKLQHEGH